MSVLDKFWGLFSNDIGIDLGTCNTLVYVKGKGIVVRESSVVAVNQRNKQILAIGDEAKRMIGRTPAHIVAIRPLIDGVVSDFEVTEQMLKYFIEKIHKETFTILPRPRVIIGIPYGVTEVERRAVEEAAINAGARQVFLIEEPMAAAIGSRLPVHDAAGSMIIDVGGGTTEVAVLSLGGIVASRSIRIAGDEMNEDIMNYARQKYNLLVGEQTSENVKIEAGSAYPLDVEKVVTLRGRNLITGLPEGIEISSVELREALRGSVAIIVETVRQAIDETPPELVADLMQHGIALAGGGALLQGLDKRLSEETRMRVYVAEEPLSCVARGAGQVLETFDVLEKTLASMQRGSTLH